MNTGRYDIQKSAVYVSKVNGAIWDYKIIRSGKEWPYYLIATEMITGERIYGNEIKSDQYLTEAESYLESMSEQLNIISL